MMCTVIYQAVKEDCSCIFAVGPLLTRRTVGILYVLSSCFSRVCRPVLYSNIYVLPTIYFTGATGTHFQMIIVVFTL